MSQNHPHHENQPITLQQKQTLVAVYQRTGNMSQAMREASIRSPRTAYLWWHRFCESGDAGLEPRSHARHTQERLPDALVDQICQLRHEEPNWGRRQIANALAERTGRQVVSPASVEAVLRRAGLWKQHMQPATPTPHTADTPDWLRGGIDYDSLLVTVQKGIRLSIQSDARAATRVLYQQVWRPLQRDRTLWHRLLTTPELGLGSWLLSSRLHLGHCMMNCGYWPQAARYLQETIDWMQAHPIEPRQRLWEDAEQFASLRRDDVWLGCYQHLGLVLGKSDLDRAIGYLQTAVSAIHHPHRPKVPSHSTMIGDLERDLAYLKLRLWRLSEPDIRQHLNRARQVAEDAGSLGIQAFTHFAWAKLYGRLAREAGVREQEMYRQRRNQMEHAIHQALELMEGEQEDRHLRLTLCFVDAAQLTHEHGIPIESQWIQRAAEYCLTYGYGGQAQQLLAIPGIHTWLSEDMLRNLARSIQPPSLHGGQVAI